jgi:hypothetical protein
MPRIENKKLLGRLLKSTIGVIGRRTSEPYANVIVSSTIDKLKIKYPFLNSVRIIIEDYSERFDVVDINNSINVVDYKEIGRASCEFIQYIIDSMGKDAGYYFIREIRDDLPYAYEKSIKEAGLDLDILQLRFINDIKQHNKFEIKNDVILRYMLLVLYEVLERDSGRNFAYETINETVNRSNISYEFLKHVKINDIRSIPNVDICTVDNVINSLDPIVIGQVIQKIIKEIFKSFEERKGFLFIDNLKNLISLDYAIKLNQISVNLDIIKLNQELIVKNVLKTIVDVISNESNEKYAISMVNNILRIFEKKFDFLKEIRIDGSKYAQGKNGIIVPKNINSVRASELGRCLQNIIENISIEMDEGYGKDFVDTFKSNLGRSYLLRIEELGVNLHMIELRNSGMY